MIRSCSPRARRPRRGGNRCRRDRRRHRAPRRRRRGGHRGRRQRREFAHDRELADLTELRSVLDAAARALARAAAGLDETQSRLATGRAPGDDQVAALHRVRDELAECARRIRIRLGPGATLTAFDAARDAHAGFTADALTGTGEAGRRAAFDTAHDDWFAAAHQLVMIAVTPPSLRERKGAGIGSGRGHTRRRATTPRRDPRSRSSRTVAAPAHMSSTSADRGLAPCLGGQAAYSDALTRNFEH